jgi:hypothetical protein
MVERIGSYARTYTKYGISISGNTEDIFYYFLQENMIDNLTYVEAIELLRQIKKE